MIAFTVWFVEEQLFVYVVAVEDGKQKFGGALRFSFVADKNHLEG